MLAAGTKEGVLWAFSRTGEVLWTYDNDAPIEQVMVAPDDSCIVFSDYIKEYNYLTRVKCVRNGELIWSKRVKGIWGGLSLRRMAFSPDSSYIVYASRMSEPGVVLCNLDGTELWSHPLKSSLNSIAITQDCQYILLACHKHVYKFSFYGELVWEKEIRADNRCIAITPRAEYVVIG